MEALRERHLRVSCQYRDGLYASGNVSPMRVLVLTQYYWPEAFRINEVVESLRGAGCDVTVLTGQPNYPDGKIFPGYRAWGCGRQNHSKGYSVYRVPIVPRGAGTAWRLALNYLSFVASAIVQGARLLR